MSCKICNYIHNFEVLIWKISLHLFTLVQVHFSFKCLFIEVLQSYSAPYCATLIQNIQITKSVLREVTYNFVHFTSQLSQSVLLLSRKWKSATANLTLPARTRF
jgi:hypothetical protein